MFFQCMAKAGLKKLSSNSVWKQEKNAVGIQDASTIVKIWGTSRQLFGCISAQSAAIRSREVWNLLQRKDCCCGTSLASSPGEQKAAPHNCWSTQSPLFSQVSQLQRLLPLPESKSSPPCKAAQQLHDRKDFSLSISFGGDGGWSEGVLTLYALRCFYHPAPEPINLA